MNAHTEALYFGNEARRVLGYGAIVNDKGDFIAPATDRYHIINHTDVMAIVKSLLDQAAIEVASEDILLTDNHARMRIRMWFAGERARSDIKPGDTIQLGLQVRNTYDLTSGVQLQFVAKRLLCSNGMTGIGTSGDRYYQKHMGTLNTKGIQQWFASSADFFAHYTDTLRQLPHVRVHPEYFRNIFTQPKEGDEDPAVTAGLAPARLERLRALPERTRNKITSQFQREEDTAWGGFNAITHIASHQTRSPAVSEKLEQAAQDFADLILRP